MIENFYSTQIVRIKCPFPLPWVKNGIEDELQKLALKLCFYTAVSHSDFILALAFKQVLSSDKILLSFLQSVLVIYTVLVRKPLMASIDAYLSHLPFVVSAIS